MNLFIKKISDHTCEDMPKDWNPLFVTGIVYRDKLGRLNNHGCTQFLRFECVYGRVCPGSVLVRVEEIEDHIKERLKIDL